MRTIFCRHLSSGRNVRGDDLTVVVTANAAGLRQVGEPVSRERPSTQNYTRESCQLCQSRQRLGKQVRTKRIEVYVQFQQLMCRSK